MKKKTTVTNKTDTAKKILAGGLAVIFAVAAVIMCAVFLPRCSKDDTYDGDLNTPFSKGVNFSNWLENASPEWTDTLRYTEKDVIDAKNMGIQIIRLPVNLHKFVGSAPDYTLDAGFMRLLDTIIGWAQKNGLYLVLDNHSWSPSEPTPADVGDILIPVWKQVATRYKNKGSFLLFEILNEPWNHNGVGIDSASWMDTQRKAVEAIRTIDKRRVLVVCGINDGIDELEKIPDYGDNIMYTFHFYDPFFFTHQGATWGIPPLLDSFENMPFPASASEIPPLPSAYDGMWWFEEEYRKYPQTATVERLEELLDKVAAFSKARNATVLCGEFGVYMNKTQNEDRLRWYQIVAELLDERNIPRTSWDYYGPFGLFKTGDRYSITEHDINVDIVKALGFTPPAQTPKETLDSAFTIYENYPDSKLADFWSDNGSTVDYYHNENGKAALAWGKAEQYTSLSVIFVRDIDWQKLIENGFSIVLRIKADKAANLQVRFVDDEATGNPWRVFTDIDIPAGGDFKTVTIPLKDMTEFGAWIDGVGWIPPNGEFSPDRIKHLQFTAENGRLDATILFDCIEIK